MKEPDPKLIREIDAWLRSRLSFPEDTCVTQPYGVPVLPELDIGFNEALLLLCDEAGISEKEFYKRANLSRQLFNALKKNKEYRPTRTTVFACAIALQLPLDKAKDLLLKAGYAFSRSNKTDVIVQYFIENKIYDIDKINSALYYYDQQPLGSL